MSLIATATEVAITLASVDTGVIVRSGLAEEAVRQSEAFTVAIKSIAGVAFLVYSIFLILTSHGKIGKILGALAVLGLAGWIVFGTGWSWFAQQTEEQLNSAPASYTLVVDDTVSL